jgi:hypothetical protein
MRTISSLHSLFFSLLDCRWLLADKPDFDWTIVNEDAAATNAEVFARLAAELLNHLVVGLIPDRALPVPPALEAYCRKFIAEDEYFSLLLNPSAWAEQILTA